VIVSHLTPLLTLTHDRESDTPIMSAVWGLSVLIMAAVMVLITRPTN
jgi:hypothetical protein